MRVIDVKEQVNLIGLTLPRTQAHSSGFESDWDFNFALGIMGRAKRMTRLADYDFKMAESNLCKTRGKEKESFFSFTLPSVLCVHAKIL